MSVAASGLPAPVDTNTIKEWRSIVTLIVFFFTNVVVLFPFHIPVPVPKVLHNAYLHLCTKLRLIDNDESHGTCSRIRLPMDLVTVPVIAVLFLLAIGAIGRDEVSAGTIGEAGIKPYDVLIFFITLAYIAISLDSTGLIKFIAFKILVKAGKAGHRLFLYLYLFFFGLASFIGNDPIILTGTAFLAYMTRASSNIDNPRAWIFMQFSVANMASAVLVSSNPTNLVLASAFGIEFITYTANMFLPVIATAVIICPFLLYVQFRSPKLIPKSIMLETLSAEAQAKIPLNPNIPGVREAMDAQNGEQGDTMNLEEIMNPYVDKRSAWFASALMAVTLITVLVINALSDVIGTEPVFFVTLPAAVVMFCWDLMNGWQHRDESRRIARESREIIEAASVGHRIHEKSESQDNTAAIQARNPKAEESDVNSASAQHPRQSKAYCTNGSPKDIDIKALRQRPATLASKMRHAVQWTRETFPTTTAVLAQLPLPLIPFSFAMFILVQALVKTGWIMVFGYGWDHWVNATGTVGAIGGMGFLAVMLCNFAGTNIGTTILLSRMIQAWQSIHIENGIPISNRTFWAAVYTMALGVNYGAYSTSFSASLAGLLWRDILARKHIQISAREFARQNFLIVVLSMIVGCVVLLGEVYVVRGVEDYSV